MICDFDDFDENNHRLDLLHQLKEINPAFKVTLFAIPARGSTEFWDSLPDWIELAVHGWTHESVYECRDWTADKMRHVMHSKPARFVDGFKAPGWQISDGCYQALLSEGWWVADQHLEDHRRPAGLRTYFYEDAPDRWHGHIQDVCGNGLAERWEELVSRVKGSTQFRFCSEALS